MVGPRRQNGRPEMWRPGHAHLRNDRCGTHEVGIGLRHGKAELAQDVLCGGSRAHSSTTCVRPGHGGNAASTPTLVSSKQRWPRMAQHSEFGES